MWGHLTISIDYCLFLFFFFFGRSVAVKGPEWSGYLRLDTLINSAVSRSRRHLTHRGPCGSPPRALLQPDRYAVRRHKRAHSICSQRPINRCCLIRLVYVSETLNEPRLSRLVLHKESSWTLRPPGSPVQENTNV